MKITKIETSASAATAIATTDTGTYYSLDVIDIETEGKDALIEDANNGELADYLSAVAYGSEKADIKVLIDERRASATDWTTIYQA